MKKVRSSLKLDLDLSLPHSLQPRWTNFLSILQGRIPSYQAGRHRFSVACLPRSSRLSRAAILLGRDRRGGADGFLILLKVEREELRNPCQDADLVAFMQVIR